MTQGYNLKELNNSEAICDYLKLFMIHLFLNLNQFNYSNLKAMMLIKRIFTASQKFSPLITKPLFS